MTKRRILAVLTLILIIGSQILLSGCATHETSIPIPKAEANVYVYDDDGLFDQAAKTRLNNMLIDLEKKTGAEFAVITVKSLQGNSLETYANKVANSLGIGKKDQNNGVLLLMSKSDKRVRLEIGKGLEGILNDAKCGQILDKFFVPHRDKNEYVKATELTVQAVINVIATDKQVTIDGADQNIATPEPFHIPWWGWLLIVIVIIIIIVILVAIDDGSGGIFTGGSGSGFGGGSSGGGFGGGGFGGGGASR